MEILIAIGIFLLKLPVKLLALAVFLPVKALAQITLFFSVIVAVISNFVLVFMGILAVIAAFAIMEGSFNGGAFGVMFFLGLLLFFMFLPKLIVCIPAGFELLAAGLWRVVRW